MGAERDTAWRRSLMRRSPGALDLYAWIVKFVLGALGQMQGGKMVQGVRDALTRISLDQVADLAVIEAEMSYLIIVARVIVPAFDNHPVVFSCFFI